MVYNIGLNSDLVFDCLVAFILLQGKTVRQPNSGGTGQRQGNMNFYSSLKNKWRDMLGP